MSKTENINQKYIDKYISELQDSRFYIEDDVVRECTTIPIPMQVVSL